MSLGSSIISTLSLIADTSGRVSLTNRALVMFLTLAGVLALFLLVIVLLGISARQHQRDQKKTPEPPRPDPWTEAGKRAKPLDGGPDPD